MGIIVHINYHGIPYYSASLIQGNLILKRLVDEVAVSNHP